MNGTCSIWLATNAAMLLAGHSDMGGLALGLRRTGLHADDGWMTPSVSTAGCAGSWARILEVRGEAGRDTSFFVNALYSHMNIDRDGASALADSKPFPDAHYRANYTHERLKAWGAFGNVSQVVDKLRAFRCSGCQRVTSRLSTMKNPFDQLRCAIEEVLPAVNAELSNPLSLESMINA